MWVSWHKPAWPVPDRPAWWVAGAAALAAVLLGWLLWPTRPAVVALHRPSAVLSPSQQMAREQCVEGAMLFHDVRWAVACARLEKTGESDGHADCDLPPDEAERLDGQLQRAEQVCRAEAARAPR